jgi:hypothetical protein
MDALDAVDADTLLSGRVDWLDADLAGELVAHPLDGLDTEYPHHGRSLDGPDDEFVPSEAHPAFYGCYDWHSAVHSHWTLARTCRLVDDHPREDEIRAALDARLTPDNVAAEVDYLDEHPGFERPYGWGWLLRLAAELATWDDAQADEWRDALRPLEATVRERVADDLLEAPRPNRTGTHGNTAFALSCVLDYARVVGADDLAAATAATVRRHYGEDRDAPVAYEPLGWDFLSPSLVEADCVRRVLDPDAYADWLDGFLPDLTSDPHVGVLEPLAAPSDDGHTLHLVGCNLSRAWCLADLQPHVRDDATREAVRESARAHAEAGVSRAFTDDYAGAHWLSSFVTYLVSRHEGGIAPR